MKRPIITYILIFLALFQLPSCKAQTEQSSNLRTLKLKIYRYHFASMPELSSQYSDNDISDAIDKVNGIWKKAGIIWVVDSIEDADIDESKFPRLGDNPERTKVKQQFINASPTGSIKDTWKVVLIREFPVPGGGLYLPNTQTVYFAETARGGKTNPIILAHELGHSLGLPHDRADDNLMHRAAGGRGRPQEKAESLTASQIDTTQKQALLGPLDKAYESGDAPQRKTGGQQPYNRGGPQQAGAGNSRKQRIISRLKRFDYDNDGVIEINDVPSQGQRAFNMIDENRDGRIDSNEMDAFSQ